MKYKKSLLIICLTICLFSIASVCASDVNETVASENPFYDEMSKIDDENLDSSWGDFDFNETLIKNDDSTSYFNDDVVNVGKCDEAFNSYENGKSYINSSHSSFEKSLNSKNDDLLSYNGEDDVLGTSPPYYGYSVSVSDSIFEYGSSEKIVMRIVPADSSYYYKYDFYMNVYDSKGDEKISQRFYGTSSNDEIKSGIAYLNPGYYTIKLINYDDSYVMSSAKLQITSIPHNAYSVNLDDNTYLCDETGVGIEMNIITPADSSYKYKYDFYLKIFDSEGNEKISERFYDTSYSSYVYYFSGYAKLISGDYTIKLMNAHDGYVMSSAKLTVRTLDGDAFSVSVSDTLINYGTNGNIVMNIVPSDSSYYLKYNFNLKIYDSNGNEIVNKEYYSTSSKYSETYMINSSFTPGIYTIRLFNYYDDALMGSAKLIVKPLTYDTYSVSVSDTTFDYGIGGDIVMNITPSDSSYAYKHDFYLYIYNSDGKVEFSQRYYSASPKSQIICSFGSSRLVSGNYTIKIVNSYDKEVISTAKLSVVSVPYWAYSVNISDTTFDAYSGGDVIINITPANSSYGYKYDFYLKIFDSKGNEEISQRYYSNSPNSQITHRIPYSKLSAGTYTIKIINNYDNHVMGCASLSISLLPHSAYSVKVSDTKFDYGYPGNIEINIISSAGLSYNYAYNFYLKVYDSNGNEKISENYKCYSGSSYNPHITYYVTPSLLDSGSYTIKLLNYGDNYVMSSAKLLINSVPASEYSVNISDTFISYGSSGNIVMNITPANYTNKYKHDFYLKIYDSMGNEKISERYYDTSSYNYKVNYGITSYQLSPGVYTMKLINSYDDYIMSVANLYVVSIPHNDYGVNISNTLIQYGFGGNIVMNIAPANSSYNYKYDFYLNVYNSNGDLKISERFNSTSFNSQVSYYVDSSQLSPGSYRIKIINSYDDYVMGSADLNVSALTYDTYSVSVSDTTISYESSGSIVMNIAEGSLEGYDFYLNVYDLRGNLRISERYNSNSFNSQVRYYIGSSQLSPGSYRIKIINSYDDYVMGSADLNVKTLTSDVYSVSVSDTIIPYESFGDIIMNIVPASSIFHEKYDFYMNVYDSTNVRKINMRYSSTVSKNQLSYRVDSSKLSPGNYTIKIINAYDNNIMSTANLYIVSVPHNAYSLSVSDTIVSYGHDSNIVVNINPVSSSYSKKYDFWLIVSDSNGNLKISERYGSTVFNSQVSYSLGSCQLSPGVYSIKLINPYDNWVMGSANLNVIALNYDVYSVSVSDTTIPFGYSGNIVMNITPADSSFNYRYDYYLQIYDSEGNVKIIERYYGTDSINQVSYSVGSSQLNPGKYTIKLINYYDYHIMDSANLTISSVPHGEYSVTVYNNTISYEDGGNFVMDISSIAQDYYKYDFYMKIYDSEGIEKISQRYYGGSSNTQELYNIDPTTLNRGLYVIKIFNNVDNYVLGSAELCVIKSPNLKIVSQDCDVGEIVTINYSIDSEATGLFSIYVNGTFIKNVTVGDEIELDGLKAGIYDIKVVYHSEEYYANCENTTVLEVYKLEPYYYIDDYEIAAGNNVDVTFVFDEDATGKVNVSWGDWTLDENDNEVWISSYNFTAQLSGGKVSFTIPDVEGGWLDYILEYSGDDRYDSLTESDYIWVNYKDSPISINIPEISWSDDVILKPILPKGATGDISLSLDNISLVNISVGDAFQYKAIKGGKHYLTIQYSGDEYFTDNETTVEFYVNKLNPNFNMETTFDSEKYITIPISLNNDANGVITVNINNEIFSGKIINGSFNFTVTDLGAGAHNAIINYSGDDKYNNIYIAKEITVNLKNSNLDLNISNILKDNNLLIKPILTENATGTVSIYVDDELKRTINVGSSYTLSKPSIGQHKIRLVYSGNTYFDSVQKEFSFRVFTIYPIEAVDTQIVYGTDKKFQAKFYDEYGEILANKYVSFIVNGTEYPIRTNSEGIAVLDVDLGVGEYNITSVSLLDESTTNKLLIFHSIQAESMIIEYGSNSRFKATFLDETANPLKNTRIVFNIDGKDTMVTTDVDGVAVLNTELSMGTHYITSINTITDENMTNKVVVVSDINSIVTIQTNDINYNQKAIVKVNIDPAYLNANVTVKVTGDNGYEQVFTQNAAKTITKELSNLNSSRYFVDVKYEDSDLLVIQKNATFNVLKIDPSVTSIVDDGFAGHAVTLEFCVSNSNGTLTVKIDDDVYYGQLADGRFVKDIEGLSVGQHSFEVLFNGDNNYNPLIKTGKFNVWNKLDFEVDFGSIVMYEDDEDNVYVYIQKLTDNENAILTLFIDGIKAEGQSFTIYESDNEYYGEIVFNGSNLNDDIHNWKIIYYDAVNYINSSKTGLVKVYHVGNPDKLMLVTNDGIIADIDNEFEFVKNGTIKIDEDYEEYYTIYSFTADGVEYAAIRWFPVTFYSVGCYKVFNPNEYKSFDGIYYKTTNGLISDVIDSYEKIDGIYFAYVGRPYDYYNNGYDLSYSVINGTCYKLQYYHYYEAVEGVDYKVVDGIYYTIDDIKIYDESEYYDGFVIIKNGRYYFNDNLYFHHIMSTVGYEYVKVNNDFYRLIQTYENEELHNYALIDGKLYPVIGDSIGDAVKINVTQTISEDEIHIPLLDNISGGESIEIKLPSDATGTVTLTVNGKNYNFNVENGVANIKLPELTNGNYNYTITYSGDSKYSSFTSSDVMVVNNTLPHAVLIPDVIIPHLNEGLADGFVIVIVPSDVAGKVILSVDGKKYNFNVNNGKANVTIPYLADGTYEYSITYVASSKYANYTDIGLLVVNNTKPAPEVVIPPLDNPSEDGSVEVKLPSDAKGNVTLTINNTDYVFEVVNGIAKVIMPELDGGNYQYTITYSGDSKYSSFVDKGNVNIAQKIVTVKANNMTVTYGSGYDFIATFLKADGSVLDNSYVLFNVNGEDNIVKTDSNGIAILTLGLGNGTYVITSTNLVTGESANNVLTIVGEPAPILGTVITSSAVSTVYNGGKYLVITLKDINGNPLSDATVTVVLGGKTYTLPTDPNGQLKVSTNGLKPNAKAYTATITFNGNSKYDKSAATAKVTVKKANVKLAAKAKAFKRTDKTKAYPITLKDNLNKPMNKVKVYLKVGKKTYAAVTTKKGVATFKLTKLTKKGTYVANFIYKGNALYNKLTKNIKIVVK